MGTSDKRHGSNSNQALHPTAVHSIHIYEIRPRKNHQGVNLISDALPFGCLWYGEPNAASNAIDYAKFRSRSHRAVIRVYDEAGNVIMLHQPKGWRKKTR
jgi:CobQ-like glutamine amidotransferase family enzyme